MRGRIVFEQVAQRFAETVGPFLGSCPATAGLLPPGDAGTQALYLWATAVIASYSFTIGDDRRASLSHTCQANCGLAFLEVLFLHGKIE